MKKYSPSFLLLLLVFLLLLPSLGWGANVYIDPTCATPGTGANQACGGVAGDPKATWASVTWIAGNSYLQKGGTIAREQVVIGGGATNAVTLGSYGTGQGIVQPTIQISSWTQVGSTNVWYGSVEIVGPELVTNGNFTNWTGDNPDGWTVMTETATEKVTQNPAGNAQILNGATTFYLYQPILAAGLKYKSVLTISAVALGTVYLVDDGWGWNKEHGTVGTFTDYFTAVYPDLFLWGKGSGADITVDSLSVKQLISPVQAFLGDTYLQPAHWPTASGSATPTFAQPTTNGTTTSLIDTNISFNPTGATLNIYTTAYGQERAVVTGWNAGTHTMSFAALTTGTTTNMKYYLTGLVSMITEGTWAWDPATSSVYVYKTGGGNPGTVDVTPPGAIGIDGTSRSNVTVDGLRVTKADKFGIKFLPWDEVVNNTTIQNCTVDYNAGSGIKVGGAYRQLTTGANVLNNTVDHNGTYGLEFLNISTTCLAQGNTITYSGGVYPQLPGGYGSSQPGSGSAVYTLNDTTGGPGVLNSNTISYAALNGFFGGTERITNNHIDHTCLYMPDCGGSYDGGSGSYYSGNVLSGGTGYGLYFDTGAASITIINNTVTGGSYGALVRSNGATVKYNKFVGPFTGSALNISNGANVWNDIIEFNIFDAVDNSNPAIVITSGANSLIEIENNNIMNGSVGVQLPNTATVADKIKNNIFYNNTSHIVAASGNATAIDYNLYYPNTGTKFTWGGTAYNFANWKTNSSQDANSPASADPLFRSATDFRLSPASPAINAGLYIAGLHDQAGCLDYAGKPCIWNSASVDIGAYRHDPVVVGKRIMPHVR